MSKLNDLLDLNLHVGDKIAYKHSSGLLIDVITDRDMQHTRNFASDAGYLSQKINDIGVKVLGNVVTFFKGTKQAGGYIYNPMGNVIYDNKEDDLTRKGVNSK